MPSKDYPPSLTLDMHFVFGEHLGGEGSLGARRRLRMEKGESERSGAWRPIPRIPISSVEGLLVRPSTFGRGSSLNARGLGVA
eukprot:602515-Pelagomonas_calceolata.AAC.1